MNAIVGIADRLEPGRYARDWRLPPRAVDLTSARIVEREALVVGLGITGVLRTSVYELASGELAYVWQSTEGATRR
jgi:hypothetical protein